jgi:hypothetical protein
MIVLFSHMMLFYKCVHFCIKQSLATYAVNPCPDASQSYELTSLCFLEIFGNLRSSAGFTNLIDNHNDVS